MIDESRLHLDSLKEKLPASWTKEDFVCLICTRCQFYKPEKEQLECAAFKMLVELLKSEVVSVEQVRTILCK